MGIELRWWTDGTTLEYLCDGAVDGRELVERNVEALADSGFAGLEGQLCDMTGVAPDCDKVAIVAEEDLIFGFARMYEMTLDGRVPGWEVGVFRTRAAAVDWLGVEDPTSGEEE